MKVFADGLLNIVCSAILLFSFVLSGWGFEQMIRQHGVQDNYGAYGMLWFIISIGTYAYIYNKIKKD